MTTTAPRPGSTRVPWLRAVGSLIAVLVVFYALPLRLTSGVVGAGLLTVAGVALLIWTVTSQLGRHLRDGRRIDLPTLATLMVVVVVVFALGYYAVQEADPTQFNDMTTRTDALYFSLQVLSTVGLGDVHAEGQLARVLVTVQMAFDLVFIAIAGSVLANTLDRLRAERMSK